MNNMTIKSMAAEEQKYAYRQSQQIMMQCGGIGYMRGDYGRSGDGFFTDWTDFNKSRKTDEFKDEFDSVITVSLRRL